jgi:hypothetical protein
MTWRVPPYDRAIAELEAHVRSTYRSLGILVAGSIVRGEAGPTSDLDVVVIHDEAWRERDQRRFAGVPAELFVNPPGQIRRYFANGHATGEPDTAHMLATGELLGAADPVVVDLIGEAHAWLARRLEPAASELTAKRYAVVDMLDDARDVIASDPAAATLLLAEAVRQTIAYAFWRRARFQPRRKDAFAALDRIDPEAGQLARAWAAATGAGDALAAAEALALHVVGERTFFAWTSDREPVER